MWLKLASLFFLCAMAQLQASCAETDYQWTARSIHNKFRWKHYAKSLRSSNDLHEKALKCAEYYVNLGDIDHSCPFVRFAGENIWAQWGGSLSDNKIAARSVERWYNEETQYKYQDSQKGTGHFTQMVWRDSREFGFGIARKGHMMAAVAIYYPPGNYVGEHAKNVWRANPS